MERPDIQNVDQGGAVRKRIAWARALVWLAVIGVFPLTLAQWGPWAYERDAFRDPGSAIAFVSQLSLSGFTGLPAFLHAHGLANRILLQGVMWLWLAFVPAGILLALGLVWRRAPRAVIATYDAWLIIVTFTSAIAAAQLFSESPRFNCGASSDCPTITVLSRQPGWGLWVTLGALALLWIAAGARVVAPHAESGPSRQAWDSARTGVTASRAVVWRIGAAVFALGGLTWGFGLILLPWATRNCTGFPISWTHFVRGACAGLDANDAIPFVWSASTEATIFKFTSWLIVMGLLGVVAVFVLRRRWSGPVVATIWTALATWLFLQVRTGLEALLKHPPQLGFATAGAWVMGAGPLVTGVGLALCWVGAIAVWVSVINRKDGLRARALPGESVSAGQG